MSCPTCRHSRPILVDDEGSDDLVPMMECWRYPPTVVATDEGILAIRPEVTETDTCGEWCRG